MFRGRTDNVAHQFQKQKEGRVDREKENSNGVEIHRDKVEIEMIKKLGISLGLIRQKRS